MDKEFFTNYFNASLWHVHYVVEVEDVFDLLQVFVLHLSTGFALVTGVHWVGCAHLVYNDVAEINVLLGKLFHEARCFVDT